jgi:hypothetical protein
MFPNGNIPACIDDAFTRMFALETFIECSARRTGRPVEGTPIGRLSRHPPRTGAPEGTTQRKRLAASGGRGIFGSMRTRTASRGLSNDERRAIVDAVADAERGSSGEVRVHIEPRCPSGDALDRARALFQSLGMHRTRRGTGVLLYIATEDHRAAIFAGPGLYEASEASFWQAITQRVAAGFKNRRPADGIVAALQMIGERLREHAAGEDVSGNELPNELSEHR